MVSQPMPSSDNQARGELKLKAIREAAFSHLLTATLQHKEKSLSSKTSRGGCAKSPKRNYCQRKSLRNDEPDTCNPTRSSCSGVSREEQQVQCFFLFTIENPFKNSKKPIDF